MMPELDSEDIRRQVEAAVRDYQSVDPKADGEAIALYLHLVRLVEMLAGGQFTSRSLTPAAFTIVRILFFARDNQRTIADLAREMKVSATYVAKLAKGLERDGWIARLPGTIDRRTVFLHLTEAGSARCRNLIPQVLESMEASAGYLSPLERRQLKELLAKFTLGFSEAMSLYEGQRQGGTA
jgi:DNA-binding MarR family transcriptional regulator